MAAPAVEGRPIVFQKECIISKSKNLATTSFGPCYVLTGHDPKTKYSFLAHIDDMTQVETVGGIFHKLQELGVKIQDLTQVRLMGGWRDQEESAKWGAKIIKVLKAHDVPNPDLTFYHQKQTRPPHVKVARPEDTFPFYYFGGFLNVNTGNFTHSKKPLSELEGDQMARDKQYFMQIIEQKYPDLKEETASSPDYYQLLAPQILMNEPERPLDITVLD